ncbi:MAG: P1 family peptidase [Clostridia bacterium]|nr:P1 family peptidase [Clostridia bacterium]
MNEKTLEIGILPKGKRNKITDVPGVRVGHATIDTQDHKTGVTVVLPPGKNPFTEKLVGASFVLNGFGKTQGLVQVDELGTIETPIALTNTLNVGLVHDALVEYMIGVCKEDGIRLTSVNPIVCECNDASLNDIQNRAVTKEHVFSAIEQASEDFEEGDVGCGKGTTCHGLKGGVGSASRIVTIDGRDYTPGVLAQTNHGSMRDLIINGEPVGKRVYDQLQDAKPDKGSCIMIVATDLPVTDRQLKRMIKRCAIGLIRPGSYLGHGSGDVFVGFSTANRISSNARDITEYKMLKESKLDLAFRAVGECAEEAVLKSMLNADTVTGFNGNTRVSLKEFI